MSANKVTQIPRRPIRLAVHVPMTVEEHRAMYELGRIHVRAAFYEGAAPQELQAMALGRASDAQIQGDRVVITCQWTGQDAPPADLMEIIGFEEPTPKRAILRYEGIGRRP